MVGREICDSDLSDDVLNDPENPLHKIIHNNLYKAFQSGEVVVFVDQGLDAWRLELEHFFRVEFDMDITNDIIELGPTFEWDYACRINQQDLKEFLAKNRSSRSARTHTIKAETECLNWLIDLWSEEQESQKKSAYMKTALNKFIISGRAFERCWKLAIEKTGSTHRSDAGRPKKSSR